MHRNGYLGTSGNTFGRFGDVFRFLHFISWKFAVFLHLVYFTYWAKFEVDMAIHCRVIAFLLLIRRVTIWLWPALIHGGSRDRPCRNIEDPVPIRSWVVSYNVFNWLLFKMRFRLLRMRRITWPMRWGVNFANIFLESYVVICLFTMKLRWLYGEGKNAKKNNGNRLQIADISHCVTKSVSGNRMTFSI